MDAHRLRAPAQDGGVLAVPPLAEAPARLADAIRSFHAWNHEFQGRRAGWLRDRARREVLDQARSFHARLGLDPPAAAAGPLIVTGHQPELFHPGVWAKNFAVSGLARNQHGLGLNLIVDNDVPRSPTIRVPTRTERGLRAVQVEFDAWNGELPYEEWTVRDESLFRLVPGSHAVALGGQVADPVLDEFWPHVQEAACRTDRIGLRFAAARRAVEGAWGAGNAEVPLSAVCQTTAFLWFLAHLLAQLPRFRAIHNTALREYRARYGIRSKHHPVADLTARDGWDEAPFWVWRAGSARRQPLLVRAHGRTMDLRAQGEDAPFLTDLPLGPEREACCAVERFQALPGQGVRLRTRALTTTMFARLILGDLFVHGIGGAKYDELGDRIVRDFFHIEPPSYLVLSLTAWLGLEQTPATTDDLRALKRRARDLTYNPDRYLTPPLDPTLEAALRAKHAAIAGATATRRDRVARFHAIRRANEPLLASLQPRLASVAAERERSDPRPGLQRRGSRPRLRLCPPLAVPSSDAVSRAVLTGAIAGHLLICHLPMGFGKINLMGVIPGMRAFACKSR